jgi:hypothetical protein
MGESSLLIPLKFADRRMLWILSWIWTSARALKLDLLDERQHSSASEGRDLLSSLENSRELVRCFISTKVSVDVADAEVCQVE